MASYKVVNAFKDAEDNNTRYKAGDPYPKGDHKPTKKRIEELSSVHPEHNLVFIKSVEDVEEEEKESIKAELDSLGVSYHPNTGMEKLREKLEEAKSEIKE
ncbi:hypothetical protein [Bacillus infantis]|uniref:hypothetical protein n=1 Tax=Bacillus infantis TaxID=324767 RepID=UPI003CE67486